MRPYHFALTLIFMAGTYPSAQVEFLLDDLLLEDFNIPGGDWETEASLFDPVDEPIPMTENDLFNLDDDSSVSFRSAREQPQCLHE